ncbi:hypothetical protein KGP36_01770 [Patescibacteria group bacterium]|nr:hypothetical protein [Patescibacteria group bacterium]
MLNIISGYHLTATDRQAIKALRAAGLSAGKIGRTNYRLTESAGVFSLTIIKNETLTIGRGMEKSVHTITFTES